MNRAKPTDAKLGKTTARNFDILFQLSFKQRDIRLDENKIRKICLLISIPFFQNNWTNTALILLRYFHEQKNTQQQSKVSQQFSMQIDSIDHKETWIDRLEAYSTQRLKMKQATLKRWLRLKQTLSFAR